MLSKTFVGLAAILSLELSHAAPAPRSIKYAVHEETDHGGTLVKRSAAHPGMIIPIRVGLTQENIKDGHEMLMEISQHDSPKYGKLYTAEEVTDIFAPSPEAVDLVKQWVQDAGIPSNRISQSTNKQWIQFDASVEEADKLLRTEHSVYTLTDDDTSFLAASSYSVPEAVQDHIDYITPGIKGLALRRQKRRATKPKRQTRPEDQDGHEHKTHIATNSNDTLTRGCDTMVTPSCIFNLYNITTADLDTPPAAGNELGLFETQGEVYTQSDLDLFNQNYAPERKIPNGFGPTVNLIDGAQFVTDPNTFFDDLETMLDFEMAVPIVYPQKTVLYIPDDEHYQHSSNKTGFYNTFLDAIDGSYCSELEPEDPVYPDPSNANGSYQGSLQCGVFEPTNVISLSYAQPEAYSAGIARMQPPARYMQRQCNEFMKLGLQGVTFVFASGDNGVSSSRNCLGENKNIFNPYWAANCPYVLAVGATTLRPNSTASPGNEVATTSFGSGGGFSNLHDTPSYQKAAVERYLSDYAPDYPSFASHNNDSFGANGGVYNRNGRGTPDVAALGQQLAIVEKGKFDTGDGTSASTPLWAAMLTKINDMRINRGKGPMGFINPVLYAHPEIFNDVVEGSNPADFGCGEEGMKGFTAAPGWDPVTGLGTPKFEVLKEVLLGLP